MPSQEERAVLNKMLQSVYLRIFAYAPALYRLIKLITWVAVVVAMLLVAMEVR